MPVPALAGALLRGVIAQQIASAAAHGVGLVARDLGAALFEPDATSSAALARLEGRNYKVTAGGTFPVVPASHRSFAHPDWQDVFREFGPPRRGESPEAYVRRIGAVRHSIPGR